MAHKLFLGILIISSFVSNILAANETNGCSEGWTKYGKECIKIIDTDNTMTFEEAEKACSGMSLLTIHTREEQDLIETFLYKGPKPVVENVWLGIKRSGDSFKWSDGSNISFANWFGGNSPKYDPNRSCYQMLPDPYAGKWSDSPCAKKNYAVCQRLPLTLESTIEMIGGLRKTFNNYLNSLANDNWMKFELFKNTDGRQKAFFIPSKDYDKPQSRNDAVNTCKNFNDATLVDMESPAKEFLFLSYLGQLHFQIENSFIWLNGQKDSSGKWKWISSGNEISYTADKKNWYKGYPTNDTGADYLAMSTSHDDNFGKIFNNVKTEKDLVICEMYVNI